MDQDEKEVTAEETIAAARTYIVLMMALGLAVAFIIS